MKKISNIILLGAALLSMASCKGYLDVKSESLTTLDSFFTSEEDCRNATSPLYNKVWFDFNNNFGFGFIDGRANNVFAPWSNYIYPYVDLTETTSTANLYSAWQSLFVVISQSDYALNNLDRALENNVSESVVNECKAECRFMRGLAYWYLAMSWGNVPIIEDPQLLIDTPQVNTNYLEDVLAFAIRDMEYAAENLPEKPSNEGRVSMYSAKGMLARFYNTAAAFVRGSYYKRTGSLGETAEAYYQKAKAAAFTAIENGPYKLMDNYEDLFKVQNNNNSEVLFSLQWVPNSDYGTTNFTQCYLALSSTCVGGFSAWGNATYGSGELVKLFSDRGDLIRLKATYFTDGCYYDYIRSDEGGYLVGTGTGEYVDGEFNMVTKDEYSDIYSWIKKGVVGCAEDTGNLATSQNSCFDTPLLRLADVMLHYCEACIGTGSSTTDSQALEYFNSIRERAGLESVSEITNSMDYDDDSSIWNERRCELAMEYVAWTDFVRRAYYDQNRVLKYMGSQNRNAGYTYDYPTNTFEWKTNDDGSLAKVGSQDEESPSADRLLLPYPESELIMNPLLKEEPVAYTF